MKCHDLRAIGHRRSRIRASSQLHWGAGAYCEAPLTIGSKTWLPFCLKAWERGQVQGDSLLTREEVGRKPLETHYTCAASSQQRGGQDDQRFRAISYFRIAF